MNFKEIATKYIETRQTSLDLDPDSILGFAAHLDATLEEPREKGGGNLPPSLEKPRWSQCNDCFDDMHDKCIGGPCACPLVHRELHLPTPTPIAELEKEVQRLLHFCNPNEAIMTLARAYNELLKR